MLEEVRELGGGIKKQHSIVIETEGRRINKKYNCVYMVVGEGEGREYYEIDTERSIKWGFHESTNPADERHKTAD